MGPPVMTACASCYARLRTANHMVRNQPDERERAERITGKPYDGSVEVRHLLDVLVNDLRSGRDPQGVSGRCEGLRVACYYGCLLTRPPEIVAFDDAEHPTCMDDLLAAAGASRSTGRSRPNAAGPACRSRNPTSSAAWLTGSCPWPAGPAPIAWPSPARCAESTSISGRPTSESACGDLPETPVST